MTKNIHDSNEHCECASEIILLDLDMRRKSQIVAIKYIIKELLFREEKSNRRPPFEQRYSFCTFIARSSFHPEGN